MEILGNKLRSLCLQSKDFTIWAISSAQEKCLQTLLLQ